MSGLKKLTIYCNTEAALVAKWTDTTLTECPNNPAHVVDTNSVFVDVESTDTIGYYKLASASASIGTVMSVTADGQAAVGFKYPSKYIFEDKSAAFISCCAISDTQFVIVYTNTMSFPTANNGYACVCTISGTTLQFGTPVCFTGTSSTALTSISAVALNSTDIAIAYRGASAGNIVFGAVSGTGTSATVTFSAVTSFNATAPGNQPGSIIALKMSATQIVIVYRDTSNSGRGTWILGTLTGSGASITATWNTKAVFQNNTTANNQYALAADVLDSTRFIVAYDNNNASLAAVIGTIAGTGAGATITAGATLDNIDTSLTKSGRDCAILVMGTDEVLLFYRRTVDNITRGRVMRMTTTNAATAAASQTITTGTAIYYTDSAGIQSPIAVRMSTTRVVVSYVGANSNNSGELAIVDIVSSAPSLVHTGILYAPSLFYNCICENSSNQIIVKFRDVNYFNTGAAILGLVGTNDISFYETSGRVIAGVSMDAGVTNDVVRVYTGKNVDFLSGLTPGNVYYAHSDGTLDNSSAQKDNTDSPVMFGTAISATQLLKQ